MKNRLWRVETNRHPTCSGNTWGWIEGAPGNVCWSNDTGAKLTKADAERLVAEHNHKVGEIDISTAAVERLITEMRAAWCGCEDCELVKYLRAVGSVRDDAVSMLGIMRDELINSGGESGDRTVALSNLRTLIIARDAAERELAGIKTEASHYKRLFDALLKAGLGELELATLPQRVDAMIAEATEAKAENKRLRELIELALHAFEDNWAIDWERLRAVLRREGEGK
jgi:hypothetical protein